MTGPHQLMRDLTFIANRFDYQAKSATFEILLKEDAKTIREAMRTIEWAGDEITTLREGNAALHADMLALGEKIVKLQDDKVFLENQIGA